VRIRGIVFDLDDTLYPEKDYFVGGFSAVASALCGRLGGTTDHYRLMLDRLFIEEGRERVFNKAAARLPFPEDWVPWLVKVFREHQPSIILSDEVRVVLGALRRNYKLGCVTDGFSSVQRKKIESLNLYALIDAIVLCDDFGRDHWKPDPLPILTCCKMLDIDPSEAIFVGDNPERDMQGALNAGLKSIRICRTGGYFSNESHERFPPLRAIGDLTELGAVLNELQRDEHEI
jgi:putative hydrolase of the HAD superfamily